MKTILRTAALAAVAASVTWAADAKAGKTVFDTSCKACHGTDGTPNPSVAKMMKVEMKDLKSPEVQAMSDGDIRKIITEGKGKMMAVKAVTGASVDNVIAYIRTWKK